MFCITRALHALVSYQTVAVRLVSCLHLRAEVAYRRHWHSIISYIHCLIYYVSVVFIISCTSYQTVAVNPISQRGFIYSYNIIVSCFFSHFLSTYFAVSLFLGLPEGDYFFGYSLPEIR